MPILQGEAEESKDWFRGCENSPSEAKGSWEARFTQPRDHSLAELSKYDCDRTGHPGDGVDDGDGQDPDGGDHAEGRLRLRRVGRAAHPAHRELDAAEERPKGLLEALLGKVIRHGGRQVRSLTRFSLS